MWLEPDHLWCGDSKPELGGLGKTCARKHRTTLVCLWKNSTNTATVLLCHYPSTGMYKNVVPVAARKLTKGNILLPLHLDPNLSRIYFYPLVEQLNPEILLNVNYLNRTHRHSNQFYKRPDNMQTSSLFFKERQMFFFQLLSIFYNLIYPQVNHIRRQCFKHAGV